MSRVYEHSEPREQDGPPWTATHAGGSDHGGLMG
jgi:hypothetical protein